MKVVTVTDIMSGRELSYEVLPDKKGRELKSFLSRKLVASVEELELVITSSADSKSRILHDTDVLCKCVFENDEVFLFRKHVASLIPNVAARYPRRVLELLSQPEQERKYDQLKLYWAQAFCYLFNQARIYKRLLHGIKAATVVLSYKNLMLASQKERMASSLLELRALASMYLMSYDCDKSNYFLTFKHNSLDETSYMAEWESMSEMVKQYEMVDTSDLMSRIMEVQRQFVSVKQLLNHDAQKDDALRVIAHKAKNEYGRLSQLTPEQKSRPQRSEYIIGLVKRCESARENLLSEYYGNLKKVTSLGEEVNRLAPQVEEVTRDLMDKQAQIKRMQTYRQDMQWRLFANKSMGPAEHLSSMNHVHGVMTSLSSLIYDSSPESVTEDDPIKDMMNTLEQLNAELDVDESDVFENDVGALSKSDPLAYNFFNSDDLHLTTSQNLESLKTPERVSLAADSYGSDSSSQEYHDAESLTLSEHEPVVSAGQLYKTPQHPQCLVGLNTDQSNVADDVDTDPITPTDENVYLPRGRTSDPAAPKFDDDTLLTLVPSCSSDQSQNLAEEHSIAFAQCERTASAEDEKNIPANENPPLPGIQGSVKAGPVRSLQSAYEFEVSDTDDSDEEASVTRARSVLASEK